MSTGMDGQTGRHATDVRRRGIAAWPVIATGAVVLLVVATIVYFSLNRQRAVASCAKERVLHVTASSGALAAVIDAAAAFDRTAPVARSTCVRTAVTAASGPTVAVALTGNWKNQQAPAPDLWVADSEADVAMVDAENSSVTAGHPTAPFATSPLVLAVRSDRAAAMQGISWKDLASGSGVGRSLKLALPDPVANRATAATLESLIGASRPNGGPAAVDRSAVDAVRVRLAVLLRGITSVTSTTAQALTRLSQDPGDNEAAVVPVIESELAAFNTANPGKRALQAVYPTGAVGGDTLLAVPITADWVDQTSSAASATFTAYLGSAAGKSVLAGSGLRTSASPPATPAGIDRSHPVVLLPAANSQVRGSIAALWKASTTPSGGGSSSPATATATATAGPTTATSTAATTTAATKTAATKTAATKTAATKTAATTTAAPKTAATKTAATTTAAPTTAAPDTPTS